MKRNAIIMAAGTSSRFVPLSFEKPKGFTEVLEESGNKARFNIKTLERGYGITIGNSLRRILLSSIP